MRTLWLSLALLLLLSSIQAFQSPQLRSRIVYSTCTSPIALEESRSGYTTNQAYNQFLNKPNRVQRWQSRRRARRLARSKLETVTAVEEDDHGYFETFDKKRSLIRRLLRSPFRVAKKVIDMAERKNEPGTLILVRHGESEWNANQTFTGWADPDLSQRGLREAEHAARLLLAGGYEIDVVFTSRLKRAIRSAWIILNELSEVYLPVFKSWRLQERNYGALTGLSKKETAETLGADLVQQWRGSYFSRPPPCDESHPYWPGKTRKYADLTSEQIPKTESLKDCMKRAAPIWETKIKQDLLKGRNVMVVAHANTLRGLVKEIDGISHDDIQEVALPTGIPIIYKFDKQLCPIKPEGPSQIHTNGLFLEKPGLLKEALTREAQWSDSVPGYDSTMALTKRPLSKLERSLSKLNAERELGEWAGQFIDPDADHADDGSDGNMGKPINISEDLLWEEALAQLESAEAAEYETENAVKLSPTIITNSPCVTSVPEESNKRKDAILVIIRHGKTEHNKLGLFTGWEDVPLAKEGIEEAKEAGKLLKIHGFEFDVVYTSWLSRAIETAWHVMDEMDELWLPLIKTWRLNERMYGVLTGLSKKMVAQRHGDEQFKAWRRGYKVNPPPVSSFSINYPGNDKRYLKYLNDVRWSVSESLIRSIEARRFSLRRKLPKSESLKNCMDRTIPYFTERIVPEALDQGKRVLISSSENAIRGLLMHLCEIPEDKITGLEIPNGLPLIFDLNSKCIKLLDDGTGRDPLEVHNFGKAANYLFRPCQNEDGSDDEECDVTFIDLTGNDSEPLTVSDKKALDDIKKGMPVQS